ncbi:nbr1 like [Olea europaea subsp. europaea]|uniref:Nbr1 like n=1 Tax=Olea europaea subsp. europaea TaxID=158383 RepID=A0A8S0RCS7_OLEEU|nr:nbr1 like [Olea europaea subsp. europaea]
MNYMSRSKTSACLSCFLISFYVILSSVDYRTSYYALIVPFVAVFLLAVMLVFVVRTTVVMWITVLVLLAFAGKGRRVLAKEGRKITSDIALYSVQIVLMERSLGAVACATILSLMAMAWLRKAD